MTMADLISKRVAQATRNSSAGVPQASEYEGSRPSPLERLLLQRLGTALVGEWNNLPVPLQRAIYERAADGGSSLNRLSTRRQMARFLHDHKKPGPV